MKTKIQPKVRNHNEYFRKVFVRTVYGMKTREPEIVERILNFPDNTLTREYLETPYRSIIGFESSRKSCPKCKAKLAKKEWVWSWGEYIYGKWNTVSHFCKSCYQEEVKGKLESHSTDCGCKITLVGYSGEQLPKWLKLRKKYACQEGG